MVIQHQVDRIFGPVGQVAGLTLIIAGVVMIFLNGWGILLILIGALTAFTVTGTEIDTDKKEFRFYHCIFGIIKIGRWHSLDAVDHITISKSSTTFTTYSRGNRSLDIKEKGFRVVFVARDSHSKVPVMKCKHIQDAKSRAEELSHQLAIPIVIG